MENKKIPDWFYDLFKRLAIKHNLTNDLFHHHLEHGKDFYFVMSDEIENDSGEITTWNKEKVIIESFELGDIGKSYIENEDEDEKMRIYNGNQFLFLSEFYDELYTSLTNEKKELEKMNETNKQGIPNVFVNPTKTKLIWKGQKNQLYNVLRQLKINNEFIGNSFNSLADFLIESVAGFENTAKETIEKELKKKTPLPKNKRVNIDVNKED